MVAKHCPEVMTGARVRTVAQVGFASAKMAVPGSLVLPVEPNLAAWHGAAQCLLTAPAFISPVPTLAVGGGGVCASPAADMQSALLEATPGLVQVLLAAGVRDDEASTRAWFPACEEAVHALFHTHPSPDKVVSSCIVALYAAIATPPPTTTAQAQTAPNGQTQLEGEAEKEKLSVSCSAARLSRFLFLLGQVSLNSLVFSEKIALAAKKAAELLVVSGAAAAAAAAAVSAAKMLKEKKFMLCNR